MKKLGVLEMNNIEIIEYQLTVSLKTRYLNYNAIKNHIASNYTTLNLSRLESTRELSRLLNINKSSVSRVLIQLEDDNFITKVSEGNHPSQQFYTIRATKIMCWLYRNYYPLSRYKKRKFLRNLTTCGTTSLNKIIKKTLKWDNVYPDHAEAVGL